MLHWNAMKYCFWSFWSHRIRRSIFGFICKSFKCKNCLNFIRKGWLWIDIGRNRFWPIQPCMLSLSRHRCRIHTFFFVANDGNNLSVSCCPNTVVSAILLRPKDWKPIFQEALGTLTKCDCDGWLLVAAACDLVVFVKCFSTHSTHAYIIYLCAEVCLAKEYFKHTPDDGAHYPHDDCGIR